MMESYVRCRARDRKQQISDNFILSKALTLNLSTLFNEKAELCNPWDFYPQTFKEDKENYEHQKLEAELADYRDKRRRWAMNLTDEGSRECNPAYFIVGKGVKMYG